MSDVTSSSDRLEALFSAVLRVDPSERGAWLQEACPDDPSLRDLVSTLVRSHEEVTGILDRGSPIGTAASMAPTLNAGDQVGRYMIDRKLGVGGMGDVYLAHRSDEQFERKVAIKVMRTGISDPDMLARFRSERQILAVLNHPNIARLYDGGVSETGLPYLVMEYIEGVPVTTYCDENKLDLDQRLGIFLDICRAVEHAHRNLIVHRDLKPGNILVTPDGQVKLLDFGIAKLLDDQIIAPDDQVLTREDSRVMTPDYASPEQIMGKPVSTASDVYALGVLLHELLTGVRPHRFAGMSKLEIERKLESTSLTRPSQRLSESPEDSIYRSNEWIKHLYGDLDSIVMMALRVEPDLRYANSERLAADIIKYQSDLPVAARQGEQSYRFSKFVKRHTTGVIVTAMVIVMILGFLTVTIINNIEIRRQAELVRAEQERTNQIAGFLSGLFSELNPNQSLGEDISARELLDRGAERIGITLRDQPLSQSDILMAIGGVYFNIFDMEKALDAYVRSYAIRDSMLGASDIRTAESQYWIARAHAELAQYDLADSLYRSAETKFAQVVHPNASWQRFRAIGDRALVYRLQGDTDAAEPLFLESISGLRAELGSMHVELARMLNNYSILLNDKGRYQESADFIAEALNINRTVTGDVNTDVMRDMTNLAANKVYLGQIAEADSLFARAQELANQLLPPTHSVRATIMNNRASLLIMLEKPVEAEALYNDVIDLRLQTVGETHPLTGIARMGLANALISQERYLDADRVAMQSIATLDASLPPTHWAHQAVRVIQAIAKNGSGDTAAAAALMDTNFPPLLETRGAKDAVIRRAARVYAAIEGDRGNTDRSSELLRIAEGETAQDSP